MKGRITAPTLRSMKERGEAIICLTAYDITSAALCEEAGADVLLVGDSLGNVVLGYDSTVPVELDDILWCLRPVARTARRALVIALLSFGSYQASVEDAVRSSILLMKAGAGAVKLEGPYTEAISAIARAGIPVMGHLGMTPQSVNAFGGHKVQGRGGRGEELIAEARAVEEAGAFAMVLELIPAELAARITESVNVPTIGIGAGPGCSGQIQVFHDVVGLAETAYRHAARRGEARASMKDSLAAYCQEARSGAFPGEENCF